MKIIKGGITAPKGFEANGIACGIKKSRGLDLALLYSEVPAVAAALFTTNRFRGNHVSLDKANLKYHQAQAILINSGNANCAVGEVGLADAKDLTQALARNLEIEPRLVLMASTGIIGKRLPVEKIKQSIPGLVNTKAKEKFDLAAQAIMTTDKRSKEIAVELEISGKKIKIGAMVKGAGMISPHLATMLCFITSDAAIGVNALKKALNLAVEHSFHRISVDGEMSTNDSVIILANGLAKNKKIGNLNKRDFFVFADGLKFVCQYLAKQIVLDGEGATKFIAIKVKGAKTESEADRVARRIANSPLFKTAMYGKDPNWGRIMAVCGATGVNANFEKLEICFGNVPVFRNGLPVETEYQRLKKILEKREFEVEVDLRQGKARSFIWTCDLSEEYVRINARYE